MIYTITLIILINQVLSALHPPPEQLPPVITHQFETLHKQFVEIQYIRVEIHNMAHRILDYTMLAVWLRAARPIHEYLLNIHVVGFEKREVEKKNQAMLNELRFIFGVADCDGHELSFVSEWFKFHMLSGELLVRKIQSQELSANGSIAFHANIFPLSLPSESPPQQTTRQSTDKNVSAPHSLAGHELITAVCRHIGYELLGNSNTIEAVYFVMKQLAVKAVQNNCMIAVKSPLTDYFRISRPRIEALATGPVLPVFKKNDYSQLIEFFTQDSDGPPESQKIYLACWIEALAAMVPNRAASPSHFALVLPIHSPLVTVRFDSHYYSLLKPEYAQSIDRAFKVLRFIARAATGKSFHYSQEDRLYLVLNAYIVMKAYAKAALKYQHGSGMLVETLHMIFDAPEITGKSAQDALNSVSANLHLKLSNPADILFSFINLFWEVALASNCKLFAGNIVDIKNVKNNLEMV